MLDYCSVCKEKIIYVRYSDTDPRLEGECCGVTICIRAELPDKKPQED